MEVLYAKIFIYTLRHSCSWKTNINFIAHIFKLLFVEILNRKSSIFFLKTQLLSYSLIYFFLWAVCADHFDCVFQTFIKLYNIHTMWFEIKFNRNYRKHGKYTFDSINNQITIERGLYPKCCNKTYIGKYFCYCPWRQLHFRRISVD